MKKWQWTLVALAPMALGAAAACSGTEDGSVITNDDDGGAGGNTGQGSGGNAGQGSGGSSNNAVGSVTAASGMAPGNCNTDPTLDDDGDGFSEDQGDCNDCDANTNPDAIEVIGDPNMGMGGGGGAGGGYMAADENCNGMVDEAPTTCDGNLAGNDVNALSGAKAIDLCHEAGNGQGWGVVTANYVRANGAALANPGLAVALVAQFGTNAVAQNGGAMLVMSSGNARPLNHPEACGSQTCMHSGAGTPPPMFPQDVPGCLGGSNINDDVALELQIKAPSNATGYSFDFAFQSFEFPEWVCTTYNDQFIALVTPPPMGSINGNVSFDSLGNPVSVNLALFDHCDPQFQSMFAQNCFGGSCPTAPSPYCPQGNAFMAGSGFNAWDTFSGSGATGWLQTTAPIGANETFTIRYAIWDTGDSALDSTVYIDNFRWTAEAGVQVGTGEVPNPK